MHGILKIKYALDEESESIANQLAAHEAAHEATLRREITGLTEA